MGYLQRGSPFTWYMPEGYRAANRPSAGTWDAIAQDVARRIAVDGGATNVQATTNGGGFFALNIGTSVYLQITGIANVDFADDSHLKSLISGIVYAAGVEFDTNAVRWGVQAPGSQSNFSPGSVVPVLPGNGLGGGGGILDQLHISPSTAVIGIFVVMFVVPLFVRKR